MSDGDTIVENEAFALPLALGDRDFCEVFEDAALEVIDMLETLGEEVGGSFFTADASGAKQGDLLVVLGIEVVGDVFGKFGEGVGMWIDRTCEGTDFDFILIAGIDDNDVGIGDQFVPVLGFDVGTDEIGRIDGGDAEGDDFLFESDFESIEWRFGSDRFFVF